MKAVLLSMHSHLCDDVLNSKKKILVRKRGLKSEGPIKCYMYMTKTRMKGFFAAYDTAYMLPGGDILDGSQKVIGEFVCEKCFKITDFNDAQLQADTNMTKAQLLAFSSGEDIYGWNISSVKIYSKPKLLSDFRTPIIVSRVGNSHTWMREGYERIMNPPRNYMYVEELRA